MEGREQTGIESLKTPIVNTRRLPAEYRYKTNFLGSIFIGGAIIGWLLLLGGGVFTILLTIIAIGCLLYGCIGILADPEGVICSAGRRLVITDACLQEIDEKANVRWVILPQEIKAIERKVKGRIPNLLLQKELTLEIWDVILVDGKRIRIPVWLLPDGGKGFKLQFDLLIYARRTKQDNRPGN